MKLAPIAAHLRADTRCELTVCGAAVHGRVFEPWAEEVGLTVDRSIDISDREVSPRQLAGLVRKVFGVVLGECRPDLVLLQGDETTAMAAAEVTLLQDVCVAHVEAGLRSGVLATPWPEEGNRREIGRMATWHFAQAAVGVENLLKENQLPTRVFLTGNPGIDRSLEQRRRILAGRVGAMDVGLAAGDYILATLHRREGWQGGIAAICEGLRDLLEQDPGLHLVLPLHPDARVRDQVYRVLKNHPRVRLPDPLQAAAFARLLAGAALVVTDSGTVQEEAPLYGRPVLVARDATEHPELLERGYGQLVGFDRDLLVAAGTDALARGPLPPVSLYGDGRAAERIAGILLRGRTEIPDPEPLVKLG